MTSVNTTCRDINELSPVSKLAVQLLFQECYKSGIKDIFITETYRSQARQNYLYEQGRTRLYDSNGKKLSVVTWTRSSNHTPRLAWDIACSPPNNLYDNSLLGKVATIAKKLGIDAGYFWKAPNYDAPHFQVSSNWKAPNGYKLEGVVGIPISSKDKITFKPNNSTEGELTMSQFETLQKQITALQNENKQLKAELAKKLDNPQSREVLATHKEGWDWMIKNNISNGSNPQNYLSREQFATLLYRYSKENK